MNYKTIEKSIAVLAIVIGILIAIVHYYYFEKLLLDRINNDREYNEPLGYFDLSFKMYIPLIMAAFYAIGGILLLLNTKAGWFCIVGISIFNFVSLLYTTLFSLETEKDMFEYAMIGIILLANCGFFLLFNKETMAKYNLKYSIIPILIGVTCLLVFLKDYLL